MKPGEGPDPHPIEELKRLVEIQSQIVELAKQNENAKKQCEVLRDELSREVLRRARRSSGRVKSSSAAGGQPSVAGPWVAALLEKLLRRAGTFGAMRRAGKLPPKMDA